MHKQIPNLDKFRQQPNDRNNQYKSRSMKYILVVTD